MSGGSTCCWNWRTAMAYSVNSAVLFSKGMGGGMISGCANLGMVFGSRIPRGSLTSSSPSATASVSVPVFATASVAVSVSVPVTATSFPLLTSAPSRVGSQPASRRPATSSQAAMARVFRTSGTMGARPDMASLLLGG